MVNVSLRNTVGRIRNIIFDGLASDTKLEAILQFVIYFLFFITILSIPLFSFVTGKTYITWVLTIALFVCMGVDLFLYKGVRLDFSSICMFLFFVAAFISTAVAKFKNFVMTPVLLHSITVIVYLYLLSNKKKTKTFLWIAYLAVAVFASVFLVRYHREILALDSTRLGAAFGDQNDISIFLALGFLFSLFLILFSSDLFLMVFGLFFLCLFSLCGLSTGSKIFLLLIVVSSIVAIFIRLGTRRWHISLIVVFALLLLAGFVLSLPFATTIRSRLLDAVATLFSGSAKTASSIDGSTSDRLNMLIASFELFLQRPIFGFGINGFLTNNSFNRAWAHNNLGEFLTDFGLIGTFLFHFGFFSSIYFYIIDRPRRRNNSLPILVLIFFMVCMISVAFTREKIYSFLSAVVFAHLIEGQTTLVIPPLIKISSQRKNLCKKSKYVL